MKPITVQDQVRLGARRCLQLAVSGMGYRMFRSGVTVAILSLAVAFLVHVLVHSLLSQRVMVQGWTRLEQYRRLGEWVARLTTPDDAATILRNISAVGSSRWADYRAEYARFAGMSEAEMAPVTADAALLARMDRYFDSLPATARVVLTGERDTAALLQVLTDAQQLALFRQRLEQLGLKPPLGSPAALDAFLRDSLPRLNALAERAAAGHARAIRQARQALGHKTALELLAQPPADMEQALGQAGFQVRPGAFARLSALAQADLDRDHLARLIQPREMRNLLAQKTGAQVATVNLAITLDWLRGRDRALWLAGKIKDKTGDTRLSAEALLQLADTWRRQQQLEAAVAGLTEPPRGDAGGSVLDLPVSVLWLVGLSFLVCVVGVANAMLMSVTERFSEIATMKCLGAMDGFVMRMFLFEAVLQGLFGGLVGIVLGLLLAVARAYLEFGGLASAGLDAAGQLLLGAGIALVCGMVLAALAAVWPAWVAARLAPMEAMRVE